MRAARPLFEHLIHVHGEPRRLQVPRQLDVPPSVRVQFDEQDAREVGRDFNARFVEGTDTAPANPAQEEPQFEDDVLTGTRAVSLGRVGRQAALIISGQQDHREAYIGVVFEFLDDCPALVRLFMEDGNGQVQVFKEAGDTFADALIAAVDEEARPFSDEIG